jgi:hypothetical protein
LIWNSGFEPLGHPKHKAKLSKMVSNFRLGL